MTKHTYGRKFPGLVFSTKVDRLLKSLSTYREFVCVSQIFRYAVLGTMGHARGCMVGCIGKISHTNLKNRMAISGFATSKNHIELPVRSETGFVILRAWANSGLDSTFGNVENNRKFFGDDQGCLKSEPTVGR